MPARYMLDTDTCIHFRSGRSRKSTDRLLRLEPGELVMSVITYGELRVGVEKSPRYAEASEQLATLVDLVSVAVPDEVLGHEYGAIRADLERRGQIIGANDLWIAAHARTAGLTLVTGNEREFRRVPGLSIENWAVA